MKKYLLLLALLVCLPSIEATEATDPKLLLTQIILAKETGAWKEGNSFGYYQVVVWRAGLEHARDHLSVHILSADAESGNKRLIRAIEIPSPGIKGYVEDIAVKMVDNRLFLAVDIRMKAMDGVVLREAFLVDHRGKWARIQEAGYQDISELP